MYEYHDDFERISHSMLEVFARSSREFHARYIARTIEQNETPSLALGSALHVAVLQPREWDDKVAVIPEMDRKTSKGKLAWAAFMDATRGKVRITEDQRCQVERMSAALQSHPDAAQFVHRLHFKEYVASWTDERSALPCKCRIDGMTTDGDVVDLKTCIDPTPDGFAKAIANFKYDRQAAFYMYGLDKCRPMQVVPHSFTFVAIQSSEPYEVWLHDLEQDDIIYAHEENQTYLEELALCYAFDQWNRSKGTNRIVMPRWRRKYE
jgi:exodeoxyribonuclease VIII